ncbi:F0F1 ATP synthase subunit B [Fictibacillus enclensis]|nr:F0F1 ATP synthase subunit B [Fictibacillus enclensis]MDM5340788.1 F0F1 ATP synthase subunit B [Fictibacillus enclensis]WHY75091.1 F0F1 ATP synthase subunit B [Fictibacillus enclensis]
MLGAATGGVNGGDILFQLLAFFILMLLLRKYAWGPLMGIMKERQNFITNEIEAAEASRKEAEEHLATQIEELKQAREEARAIIENAKKQGEAQGEAIIQASREEAERVKESALADIASEREKAVATLRKEVASLSVMIASKVIAKELDERSQEKLIQDYLQEAGEAR